MSRLSVLVPTYNEAENLPLLVPGCSPRIRGSRSRGFRWLRRSLLERIGLERIRSEAYPYQIEMNDRFVKQGAPIKQIEFFCLDRTRATSKLTLRITSEVLADWTAGHGVRPRLV